MMKRIALSCLFLFSSAALLCQDAAIRFALITDLHLVEGSHSVSDFRACREDINKGDFDFVIVSGDLTDFGSEAEFSLAKSLLDSLSVKYYAVPGNHDCKWSDTGASTFGRVFGSDTFCFEYGGWRFIGCPCGPDVRMAPGLVPKESVNWLKSLPEGQKSIFVNHYPIDDSMLNYQQVREQLARLDVRFVMGGHLHSNTVCNYGGFPGVLGRSTLAAASTPPGYTIVEIKDGNVTATERRVFTSSQVSFSPWYSAEMGIVSEPASFEVGGYEVNAKYPHVKEVWRIDDEANVATGFGTGYKDYAIYGNTAGSVKAISTLTGEIKWTAKLPGKIYSTPLVSGNLVYVGCADGGMYALNVKNGKVKWKFLCQRAVLGSPVIFENKIYFGASDGCFRALDASKGTLVWSFTQVGGFVETRPFIDSRQVVFGAWDSCLYSLDPRTGVLQWIWKSPKSARHYSPAACWPVKSAGRIFVAVPDRKVYAVDALTGKEVFHVDGGRESIGISTDGNVIFVKVMHGEAYAFKASLADAGLKDGLVTESRLIWKKQTMLGYDIAPTALVEFGGMLLIPSDKGVLHALSASRGDTMWEHKISVGLVNPVATFQSEGKNYIVASTMDGVITRLDY